MRIDIITIFPGYFAPLGLSLIGKAVARGDIQIAVHDLRDWSHGIHRPVDDTPYGGGPGMVMKPEPWGKALDAVGAAGEPVPRLVVPTPSGTLFTQKDAAMYAASLQGQERLIFACGRYEGIDARAIDEARERMPVDEVSIGDYVLAGGEAAALVMIETVCRLIPGVLGNVTSVADDSFGGHGDCGGASQARGDALERAAAADANAPAAPAPLAAGGQENIVKNTGQGGMTGLLEGPVYTKPRVWRGREVPPVLLSGDHGAIARWRRDAALLRTAKMRPELIGRLAPATLDDRDREVLSGAGFPVSAKDMAH